MINSVERYINSRKSYFDNYEVESKSGTKEFKENYKKNAFKNKQNELVIEKSNVESYISTLKNEILNKSSVYFNIPVTDFSEKINNKNTLFDYLFLNMKIHYKFKLDINFLISKLNDNINLFEFNSILNKFINKFQEYGINLSLVDFNYSFYTNNYMKYFFKNNSDDYLESVFEEIFYDCPDLIMHFKYNLISIVDKYDKDLKLFIEKKKVSISDKMENINSYDFNSYFSLCDEISFGIENDAGRILNDFLDNKYKLENFVGKEINNNLNIFLINQEFCDLDVNSINRYRNVIDNIRDTLRDLSNYYKYEFIISDLKNRHLDFLTSKRNYISKNKELDKADNERKRILKQIENCKIDKKANDLKLKLKNVIKNIDKLNNELVDLEANYYISMLNPSASINDCLLAILNSYRYCEKIIYNHFKCFDEVIVKELIEFIVNPNNILINKINAFEKYDIKKIISDKYMMLNYNVSGNMIDEKEISNTLDTLNFLGVYFAIDRSKELDFELLKSLIYIHKNLADSDVDLSETI